VVIGVVQGRLSDVDTFELFFFQGSQSVVGTKHLRSDARLHLRDITDFPCLIFILLKANLRVLITGLRLDNKTFLRG
jgi:hypothetical protein